MDTSHGQRLCCADFEVVIHGAFLHAEGRRDCQHGETLLSQRSRPRAELIAPLHLGSPGDTGGSLQRWGNHASKRPRVATRPSWRATVTAFRLQPSATEARGSVVGLYVTDPVWSSLSNPIFQTAVRRGSLDAIQSTTRSPIMTTVAWAPPDRGMRGITDASTTHNPWTPLTLQY